MPVSRAYAVMLDVCAAGIAIDALERLAGWRKYASGGLYDWTVLRQRYATLPPAARACADRLFQGQGRLIAILCLRLAAVALLMLDAPYSTLFSAGLTVLVITHILLGVRTAGFGTMGSDPMTLVICGAAWWATVATHGPLAARAGLWFVTAQSCLGYVIAGVAKLRSVEWRSGAAMTAVMSTHTYGNPTLHALLRRRPSLSRALGWAVMLWETAFPVVLILPDVARLPFLAVGLIFHGSLAALMGLNLFLFAFPATYVAIWAVVH